MRCPACDHENIQGVDLCGDCGMDLAGLDVKAWGVDPADPLLAAKLRELPLKRPSVLGPGATVSEAIKLMRECREGCIFVCEKTGEVVGVFTERDVTARIAARGRDPERTRLAEVMTRQPLTLEAGDPLAWALHRMGVDGHRHIPVLDGGRLIGFLSSRIVLERLADS